jgi:hypothetical protein
VLFGPTWSLAQEDAITALDNDVVSVVLRDLTTYRGDDAIIDGFGPSLPIPVLRKPMNGPVSSETERCGLEKKSWSRLTTREQRATKEAAKRLRERAVRAVAAGEFQIKVSGVEMRDEHQKPARSDVMFDRAIDGALKLASDGRVTTSDGLVVQGGFQPIPAGTTDITISPSGDVTTRGGGGTQTFKVTLVRFANPAGLSSEGRNLYRETPASGSAPRSLAWK